MRARLAFALAALGLGLFKLADKGLWLDEAVALRFALSPPATWIEDNNMALFYALLSLVVRSFGDGEAALRMLSVLGFAASAPVFHALLQRAFDHKTAQLGCALFVANAYLLHFAQEARGYMLAVLLTISASYALIRISDARVAKRWSFAYALTIVLALYAHAFALWVLAAHGLCALYLVLLARGPTRFDVSRRRAALRPLALAFSLAGLGAAPLVLGALRAGATQISWIARPTLDSTLGLLMLFAGGSALLAVSLAASLLGLLALTVRSAARSLEDAFPLLLLSSWFLVPVLGALTISRLFTPIAHPKYLLVCLPALLAGAAVCLARLAPRLRAPACAVLLLACASGLHAYYAHYQRERWREVVAYLAQNMGPGDRLVLDLSAPEAFDYYVLHTGFGGRPALPRPLFPDRPWSLLWPEVRAHDPGDERARFAAVERIWLVQNRSDDRDLRARLTRTHSPAQRLAFEPRDGDDRSLFASSQGRVIRLESFVRSPAAR